MGALPSRSPCRAHRAPPCLQVGQIPAPVSTVPVHSLSSSSQVLSVKGRSRCKCDASGPVRSRRAKQPRHCSRIDPIALQRLRSGFISAGITPQPSTPRLSAEMRRERQRLADGVRAEVCDGMERRIHAADTRRVPRDPVLRPSARQSHHRHAPGCSLGASLQGPQSSSLQRHMPPAGVSPNARTNGDDRMFDALRRRVFLPCHSARTSPSVRYRPSEESDVAGLQAAMPC